MMRALLWLLAGLVACSGVGVLVMLVGFIAAGRDAQQTGRRW